MRAVSGVFAGFAGQRLPACLPAWALPMEASGSAGPQQTQAKPSLGGVAISQPVKRKPC